MPQTLMLYSSDMARPVDADAILSGVADNSALATWVWRVQSQATVVIATTGALPELAYIQCHRKERWQLMLIRRLQDECSNPGMLETVLLAARRPRTARSLGLMARVEGKANFCDGALGCSGP